MARLSFIEQERIARNMTDTDILGEYEQKGSVLPPGIALDQSVLLGEMEGRTYVRDATSAAETAANMQSGSTADQQVEKFKGGMEGVQQLLAMGPQQGMGPQGMPPQGMPQGMPQQMGPQMAYDGGVIGYQDGGQLTPEQISAIRQQYNIPQPTPEYNDYGGIAGAGLNLLTGSRSLDELLDNKGRAAGRAANIGLTLATLHPALRMARLGARGIGLAARKAGALGGGRAGGIGGLFGRGYQFMAGGRGGRIFDKTGSLRSRTITTPGANASVGPGGQLGLFGQPTIETIRRTNPEVYREMLKRLKYPGIAGLYLGSQVAGATGGTEDGISDEDLAAQFETALGLENRNNPGGPDGGGSGALAGDLGKMYSDQIRDQVRQQTWLQTATDDEKRFEAALSSRGDEMLSRINPERDRNELLYRMAGGAARALEASGRGESSVDALLDLGDEVRRRGREQRTERQGLEDLAFNFSTIPLERQAGRSRQSTFDLTNATRENYRNQLATLMAQQMQSNAMLSRYGMQDRADFNDLEAIRDMVEESGGSMEEADAIIRDLLRERGIPVN